MKGNGRSAAVGVAKLSVRAALPDFRKTQLGEQRDDLARLEDRRLRHALRHFDGLSPDEHALEFGGAILKKHFNHLLEV